MSKTFIKLSGFVNYFALVVFLLFIPSITAIGADSRQLSLIRDFTDFYPLWFKSLDLASKYEKFDSNKVLTLYNSEKNIIARGPANKKEEGYLFYGRWIRFYPGGGRLAVINYKNGYLEGNASGYYKNGSRAITAQYKAGYLHGKMTRYDSRGRLLDVIEYDNGQAVKHEIKIMLLPSFQRPGNIPPSAVYNEKDDIWIQFSEKSGFTKIWYRNGEPFCEIASFKDDTKIIYHGIAVYWDKKGNRILEGFFKQGKRHGTWQNYNESGAVINKTIYQNGEASDSEE